MDTGDVMPEWPEGGYWLFDRNDTVTTGGELYLQGGCGVITFRAGKYPPWPNLGAVYRWTPNPEPRVPRVTG